MKARLSGSEGGIRIILGMNLQILKPFSEDMGLIIRPTHDRLAALRQASRNSPKGEYKGGGKTWPASLSPFHFVLPDPF